jgi:uncharacterized phage protein (TIGR02216 family)
MGALNWPPNAFWAATPHEVRMGIGGWKKSRGLSDITKGMTRNTLDNLMAKFPD